MKTARFGRPPLAPEVARNQRVVTFVTEDELKQLKKMTEKRKGSVSAVCHAILTDYLNKHADQKTRRI